MKKHIFTFAFSLLMFFVLTLNTKAQSSDELYKLNFKNRKFIPQKSLGKVNLVKGTKKNFLLQFNEPLTAEAVSKLKAKGIRINGQVSTTTLSVYAKDNSSLDQVENVRWVGSLEPSDKISQVLEPVTGEIYVVANFHHAANPDDYLNAIVSIGAEVVNNNYLTSHDRLLKLNKSSLQEIAAIDGIAYIIPASEQLINGEPVHKCVGAMTEFGMVPEYVTEGNGWDGPGLGSANLKYHFLNGTPDVSGEQTEVVAALQTWSKYVQVDWTSTSSLYEDNSFDISWGADEHGDGFPFDGPGNVLAHCFYPSDKNPEPIAGDMHFDEDEDWNIGSNVDIFSVALHESGHGLGLNHSDDPTAVMYPYYSGAVADLRPDDITGIRSLYATRNTDKTSPPVFNPVSGFYASPLEVRLEFGSGSTAQNTRIYYTLDNSEPTSNSFEFIPGTDYIFQRYSNTIKARAFKQGLLPSDVVSATYVLNQANPTVENPVITPNGGTFNGSVEVSMSCPTDFSVIRYTTNGTEPTQASFAYSSPITVASTSTVKAKAFRNDYTPSQTVTASFTVQLQIPAPTIYPPGGVFNNSVTVYLGSTVLGAEIYYTTDGSIPDQNSTQYSVPIVLPQTTLIKAVTIYNGTTSSVVSNWFNISPNATAPVITPESGNYTGSVTVSMTTTTQNGIIRYTTNGAEPTSYSNEYNGSFALGIGSHTVKAKTFHQTFGPSTTTTADFNVYQTAGTTVATPTMKPSSTQTFTEPVKITMDCATEGAVIRYTVGFGQLPDDPTEAGGGSITYNGPFTIGVSGQDMFFKVKAFKTGMTESGIFQSGKLSVTDPLGIVENPAITPNGGIFNNNVKVTLESSTQFAQVLYTKDGSDPVSDLPITSPTFTYSAPVTISQSTTLKTMGRRTFFTDSGIETAEFILQCGKVTISPDSGSFTDSVKITLETVTENAKIRYTMDGSEPSDSSAEYSEPLVLMPGSYLVKAKAFKSNFLTSETSYAELEVKETVLAPTISLQPQSKTVEVGETVKFKVAVDNPTNILFQWLRNSVELSGETYDSLVIENVQEGDAGNYYVKISNSAGEVFSDPAVLTVNPVTDVAGNYRSGIPDKFELTGNYPNPFNPSTKIRFALPKSGFVELKVYSITGQLVATLLDENKSAGYYELNFEGGNLSSGIYLYRLISGSNYQTKKMLLIK